MSVHAVALNRDQARSCVGRRNLDLDLIACRETGAIDVQLEFGVALEIAREIPSTSDGEIDFAEHEVRVVCDHHGKHPRLISRQDKFRAVAGHRIRLFGDDRLLAH